jgi:hypothetical protein
MLLQKWEILPPQPPLLESNQRTNGHNASQLKPAGHQEQKFRDFSPLTGSALVVRHSQAESPIPDASVDSTPKVRPAAAVVDEKYEQEGQGR